MRELTVAGAVRALMELAVSKGASRPALAERSRISCTDLEDADNRIPFSRYVALMRAGQELSNDPALALHFGEEVEASGISITHAMGGATNLVEAVTQGNRYAALAIEVEQDGTGDRFRLCRIDGQLWFVDARRNPNAFPELTESGFARMVCVTRRLTGGAPFVTAVHVTHAEPPYRAEYERIFRVPVTFESSRNALEIDEGILARCEFPSTPHYVTGVLRNHAEALLQKLERSQSIRDRVEQLLIPMLQTGKVSIEAIAGTLGLSRQTLFRRMRADGATFEYVLDELRHKLALNYLNVHKASVKQTARLVGYSDPSAFSRAFKRWTGVSPRVRVSRGGSPASRADAGCCPIAAPPADSLS
jgi:AraC-like DNA-binding protein